LEKIMAKVINRDSLIDWLYKKLGQGAVRPPITHPQLEDSIDEALDYFTHYAGGVGHEEQYAFIEVTEENIEVERDEDNHVIIEVDEQEEDCRLPDISGSAFIRYKHEYQLPRSVVAIGNVMPNNCSLGRSNEPILERGFRLTTLGAASTGLGSAAFGATGNALWSSYGGLFGSYGGSGGQGTRGAGGGADLVSYELALGYFEMLRQKYTIKMDAQFMEQSRKVRFSPGPRHEGYIILPVWARVQDSELYDNIWIRRYALAQCKMQIAYNVKKYDGSPFPGGAKVDGDFYLSEGKEEVEKLEQQIRDNEHSYPPGFFMG
jgi:hypothetical protein